LIMTHSVAFNIALPWVSDWITACMPNMSRRRQIVDKAIRNFSVKVSDVEQIMDSLSGGNQQKALLARWMERLPRVLILDEPTKGVDVGAREEMFKIIASLVGAGLAVLLISSDLTEVMNVSHRIALYRDGQIVKVAKAGELAAEEMMAYLTGV
jgi:ABC-type sugar transport system ATPase subunit